MSVNNCRYFCRPRRDHNTEVRAAVKIRELQGATEVDLDTPRLYEFLDMCLANSANEGNSIKHEENKKWMAGVFKNIVPDQPLKKLPTWHR